MIARHRGVLVFVEVKTHSSENFAPPELSVDERKRRKLSVLAQAYLVGLGETVDCRFDVLGITLPAGGVRIFVTSRTRFRSKPKIGAAERAGGEASAAHFPPARRRKATGRLPIRRPNRRCTGGDFPAARWRGRLRCNPPSDRRPPGHRDEGAAPHACRRRARWRWS